MVNKPKLVNTLRSMAEGEGARIVISRGVPTRGNGVVVDARGPYAHRTETSVLTVRIIANASWEQDLALLDFDTERLGYYWVFPLDDGSRVNLGVGLMGVRDGRLLKALALRYYRKLTGVDPVVLDVRGAPIAVEAPVKLQEGGVYKVGEAAGLVNSTTGEGNRYAIHSAIALAKALNHDEGVEGYTKLLQGILDEITLSRLILRLVKTLGPRTIPMLMTNAPREFWVNWFKGKLTRRTLIEILKDTSYTLILGSARRLNTAFQLLLLNIS